MSGIDGVVLDIRHNECVIDLLGRAEEDGMIRRLWLSAAPKSSRVAYCDLSSCRYSANPLLEPGKHNGLHEYLLFTTCSSHLFGYCVCNSYPAPDFELKEGRYSEDHSSASKGCMANNRAPTPSRRVSAASLGGGVRHEKPSIHRNKRKFAFIPAAPLAIPHESLLIQISGQIRNVTFGNIHDLGD
ncbi:hypothetical protein Tco_0413499 [Tanacetum coccineum]